MSAGHQRTLRWGWRRAERCSKSLRQGGGAARLSRIGRGGGCAAIADWPRRDARRAEAAPLQPQATWWGRMTGEGKQGDTLRGRGRCLTAWARGY